MYLHLLWCFMARQQHVPTEKSRTQVTAFAMVGTPQDDIAKYIGIDRKTLTKHYRHELDTAMIMANAQVGKSLYQQAKNGNTAAAIFWLKCRAGWVDKQSIEHTGVNGGPIETINSHTTVESYLKAREQVLNDF